MKAWLEATPRRANGLWPYTPQWKLADWLNLLAPPEDPGKTTTDPDFVSDDFLLHVTDVPAQEAYDLEAARVRRSFTEEYVTGSGRLSPDTQSAYTLALHFTLLLNEHHRERASARLQALILRRRRFCIATGFAGTPYIGHAQSKVGLTTISYRMLLLRAVPSWLYPITMGVTTTWERWDSMLPDGRVNPSEMTSFNHYAFGAVGDWIHKVILGMRALVSAWLERSSN